MFEFFKKSDKNVEKQFHIPHHSLSSPRKTDSNGNFYIHIHLPKTGGTTFNSVLKNNFGEAYEPFEGRFIHLYPNLNNDQIIKFIKRHPGIQAVSSHLFTAILPYQTANKKIISIAFLRDPVDKFFSYYFHMRHRFGVDAIEKKMELQEYVEYSINNNINTGGYLKHFVGEESQQAFDFIKDLYVNNHLLLFNTYYMKDALIKLNAMFPDDFKNLIVVPENISKKDQIVTDILKKAVEAQISEYDWKLMELMSNT